MLITQGHVLEARYNYLGWVKIKKSGNAADEESPEVRSSVIFYKKIPSEMEVAPPRKLLTLLTLLTSIILLTLLKMLSPLSLLTLLTLLQHCLSLYIVILWLEFSSI